MLGYDLVIFRINNWAPATMLKRIRISQIVRQHLLVMSLTLVVRRCRLSESKSIPERPPLGQTPSLYPHYVLPSANLSISCHKSIQPPSIHVFCGKWILLYLLSKHGELITHFSFTCLHSLYLYICPFRVYVPLCVCSLVCMSPHVHSRPCMSPPCCICSFEWLSIHMYASSVCMFPLCVCPSVRMSPPCVCSSMCMFLHVEVPPCVCPFMCIFPPYVCPSAFTSPLGVLWWGESRA